MDLSMGSEGQRETWNLGRAALPLKRPQPESPKMQMRQRKKEEPRLCPEDAWGAGGTGNEDAALVLQLYFLISASSTFRT